MQLWIVASVLTVGLGQLMGGFNDHDINDPHVDEILRMLSSNGLAAAPNGFTLKAVQTQVVAGINYRFIFGDDNRMSCEIDYFEQAWTNTHTVTRDTCKTIVAKQARRMLLAVGGYVPQDVTDPHWAAGLYDLVNTYGLLDFGNAEVKIIDVATQVVSGVNTKYTLTVDGKTCTLVVYEQTWTNTRQISSDTCGANVPHIRQLGGGLAGGWARQEPTDQKWSDMLTMLDTNLNLINLNGAHDLEIVAVKTQVVAGMNYDFTLRIHNQICNLVYYEQSWTNTHQIISDTCNIAVHKRQLAGGYTKQDASDPKWANLLQALDQQYHLINLQGVNGLQILGVDTQVVAGTNYKFTLLFHGKTCTLVFYEQTWTNTRQISTDTCGVTVPHTRQLAGGWVDQDPTDQKWTDLIKKLDTSFNLINLNGANDLEILAVKQQVVAGMNYDFTLRIHNQICNLVYYEQSWTNTHQITSDTCNIAVHKRQLAGGYTKQDASDPKWANLLQALDQQYHLINLQGVNGLQILGVDTQVVAGTNYKFTLLVHGKTCTLVVYEQTWTNTRQISTDTCGVTVSHTRQLAGGWVDQDPTDQKWTDLIKKLDTSFNLINLNGANDLEILAVKQQVVAGMNYDFTLRIHNQVCHLVYYEQSWTNTHQITSDTCNIAVHKRQLFGGYTKQDASDPKWANLLQQLDQQYHLINLQGDNGMQILGVDTQVVAGTNYKFTLLVHGKQCELVYFEQLWTQTRQITHDTCGIRATHAKRLFMFSSLSSGTQHVCLGAILDKINAQSNSLFRLVDAQDLQTQMQTTNGETSAMFRIQLGESACINTADKMGATAVECPPTQDSIIHSVWKGKCAIHADGSPNEITANMVSQN